MEYFTVVVTRDDVSRVKPDPALYATAVERVESEPARAFAIEDSFNGVTSAKRAGLLCVAVPNEMTRDMDFGQADVRLGSLAEMPLAALLDRLLKGSVDRPWGHAIYCACVPGAHGTRTRTGSAILEHHRRHHLRSSITPTLSRRRTPPCRPR